MNALGTLAGRWLDTHPRGVPPPCGAYIAAWAPAMTTPDLRFEDMIRDVACRADREAFAALFRHFAPRVKTMLMRGGASGQAAEELAQEAMLMVWRKAAQFDPEKAGASTWIFTIARNLRIDALRRERHPDTLLPDPTEEVEEPARADEVLATAERDGRVRAAMKTLSPEQAAVVRAAYFLDQPHAEIEKQLGIPLGTVKSRLRLAMSKLRAALEDLA